MKVGRVQGGFALGLVRQVAPIFPAGRVEVWSVRLGWFQVYWGSVR